MTIVNKVLPGNLADKNGKDQDPINSNLTEKEKEEEKEVQKKVEEFVKKIIGNIRIGFFNETDGNNLPSLN